MTLRSALAPSAMNSRQTVGRARARSDCRSAPGRRRYFRRPLDQAKRMPIAIAIDSEGVTSTRSLPICRPSIWIISRSTLDKVGCHPLGQALGRTNQREAADFEMPSPATIGRSLSGNRAAFLSLHVDTLIFGCELRPRRLTLTDFDFVMKY